MKKGYVKLSIINLLLGICAICLYLPYMLEAFNMAGFDWFKFVPNMLKDNYFDVLVYFGVFLLLWITALNVITLLSRPNRAKLVLKISTISALIIPVIYVLALKNNNALQFWIKNIAPNIKMISFIFLCVAWGSFILGLIFNCTRKNHANLHHVLQALFMSLLLTLLVAANGWCGWGINNITKIYGVLVGLFAIYLPLSSVILFICRYKRA